MKEIKINTLGQADKEGALNEIRLLASLASDYITKYYDAFYDAPTRTLCIVMDFAEEGDLAARIKHWTTKRALMPEDEIWDIVTNVVKGLRDMHRLKMMHRDIKSANIFIHAGMCAKIGDLNVSKLQRNGLAKTQTGTPYYCPPEIWADKPYDAKCDLWSLGVVLYEMCTGKPPFDAKDMQGL